MTKTINESNAKTAKEENVNTLEFTSATPNENGFYNAVIQGQEVEVLIGGSPCQPSL